MSKSEVLKILTIVFGVVDALTLVICAVILITASKNIKALQLTANFADEELAINNQYSFTVEATPSKASLKNVECVCDDPSATFSIDKDGNATLLTGGSEGMVTIYVEYKKVKSNVLTFQVSDLVARAQAEAEAQAQAEAEAAAAAEAEAAAAAEAEAAAAVKTYVKMTGDNVNVRAQNNTDCDVLGKAKQGEVFEKVETVDDWTHIIYNGQDGYIKSEYLQEVSEDEALNGASSDNEASATENKTENSDNNNNNNNAAEQAAQEAAQKAAEEAAQKAAEEAAQKAAEEAAQKAAEEAAAQAAAAAAAAAAAGSQLECADGVHTFTTAQYNFLRGFWQREGQTSPDDWKVYAHKHTYNECIQICQIEGGIY